MDEATRKYVAFLIATQTGILAQNALATQKRAPAALVSMMADAANVDPDNIPDDLDGAVQEFVEYATFTPRIAPNGFSEVPPIDRPVWLDSQSFVEDDDELEDFTDDDDDDDDDTDDTDDETSDDGIVIVDDDADDDTTVDQ
jgi:hypothetical protein